MTIRRQKRRAKKLVCIKGLGFAYTTKVRSQGKHNDTTVYSRLHANKKGMRALRIKLYRRCDMPGC